MLRLCAKQGLIHLLYLDESGCCLESPLSYGYGQIGQQKSIAQNRNRGKRINIMGVWESDISNEPNRRSVVTSQTPRVSRWHI